MDSYQACPDLPVTPFATIVGGAVAPAELIGREREVELAEQALW